MDGQGGVLLSILIRGMSHVQNLQRLRSNNNSALSKQLHGAAYDKASNRLKLDNLATIRLNIDPTTDIYRKFLDSKSITSKKTYSKRLSGSALAPSDKKDEGASTSLSIYNLSLKLPRKETHSNPLTDRRDYDRLTMDDVEELKTGSDGVSKSNFRQYYVIGKGGFGKVWKVEMKKTGKVLAMKEMYKTKIINKKSINSVMNQRELLSKLSHPFLVNMSYAFQDKQNLYLIMDFINGGDLRYHIVVRRRFTENEARFFISCLLLCVQYLHSHQIIHRDIKPENLVIQSNGYLRLTDLGISRKWREDNASDTSGTPGYMAPEVMCHKNHSFAADYFAIGVLGYEMMMGRRPYQGKDRREIRDHILSKQASVKVDDVPHGWSKEAADFVNKLLTRNPQNRLGYSNGEQVRRHPWLKSVDWAKLSKKEIKAPFIPMSIEDNYDDYKQQISQDTVIDNPEENALLLREKDVQDLFKGYEYPVPPKPTVATTKSTTHTNSSMVHISDELFTRLLRDSPIKR